MRDSEGTCSHYLSDMENACFNGLCPICLVEELKKKTEALEKIARGKTPKRSIGMDVPPIFLRSDQLRVLAMEALNNKDDEPKTKLKYSGMCNHDIPMGQACKDCQRYLGVVKEAEE